MKQFGLFNKVLNPVFLIELWAQQFSPAFQGDIRANGNVYLVNPAGVVFGPGSTVEVGRLHVVAGSLSDDNFKAGIDQFESLSGEVRNDGKITAQSVSFFRTRGK